jgi:hypothetical protein
VHCSCFEFACLRRHDGNTKGKKNLSLEEKLNMLWDADIHIEIRISLVKQLGLPASNLNTTVKTLVIKENANQCGRYQISKYIAYSVQKLS